MHEYDAPQLISPEVFAADRGPTPDYPDYPDYPGYPGYYAEAAPAEDTLSQWDLDGEFEQLFLQPAQEEPPAAYQPPPARVDRRRRRTRLVKLRWPRVLGIAIAGTTAVVASIVSVLGATVSYDPLRDLAFPTAHGLAGSWPLLIYGPWVVSCLSILHAAAHKRQVKTAWIVLTLFSGVAMALCIAHAPRTLTAIATAGLPPVSALVSFQLLFRQLTLLHPRHAKAKLPRQRKH